MTALSVDALVARYAAQTPDHLAIVECWKKGYEKKVTWRQLDRQANYWAHRIHEADPRPGPAVIVLAGNRAEHAIATLATWKLGGMVVPVDPQVPAAELERIRADVDGPVLVGSAQVPAAAGEMLLMTQTDREESDSPPSAGYGGVPRSASGTGGTTGPPRFVVRRHGWMFDDRDPLTPHDRAMGLRLGQRQLVSLPLCHGGFGPLYKGLALRHTTVLLRHFTPALWLESMERYAVNLTRVVPAMMKLIIGSLDGKRERDFSAVAAIDHGTAPCPAEVKRAWIRLLGPERLIETYSTQEQLAFVSIRGDEWLVHPGSVGKPDPARIKVIREDGKVCDPGETGQIVMRPLDAEPPVYLSKSPPLRRWSGGYYSVGDSGFLDDDGYLYVRGRTSGAINVGGTLVHVAEIESCLMKSPLIADCVVIPVDDAILGQVPRAYAVLQGCPDDAVGELGRWCRERLYPEQVPAEISIVRSLPRTASGKVARYLVEHGAWPPADPDDY